MLWCDYLRTHKHTDPLRFVFAVYTLWSLSISIATHPAIGPRGNKTQCTVVAKAEIQSLQKSKPVCVLFTFVHPYLKSSTWTRKDTLTIILNTFQSHFCFKTSAATFQFLPNVAYHKHSFEISVFIAGHLYVCFHFRLARTLNIHKKHM